MFKKHFSESKDLEHVVIRLEREVEVQKLKTALVQTQVVDLKWELTAHDPNYRAPASDEGINTSRLALAKAKEQFRERNWPRSIELLRSLIEQYPSSPYLVEAHFLLAESFYLSGLQEQCLDVIYSMMEMFPQSELTGYIMLRMGQIFNSRKRTIEAEEVYSAVTEQFPRSPALLEQAKVLSEQLHQETDR